MLKAFFISLIAPCMVFLATSLIYALGFIYLIQQKHVIINDAADVGVISESSTEVQDTGAPLPASLSRGQVEGKLQDFSKTVGGK